MKIGFIVVLYRTPVDETDRLKKEIDSLRFKDFHIYFIDNTDTGLGYSAGVNRGIQKANEDGCDVYIIANPDISFVALTKDDISRLLTHFDLGGFAQTQHGHTYYGGVIDPVYGTGGMSEEKPKERYNPVDFVSGSLMVIKKQVIDTVGTFDESYGMYYEDVDYAVRAHVAGLAVGIDSERTYEHFETSDTNPQKESMLKKAHALFLQNYGTVLQRSVSGIMKFFPGFKGQGFMVAFKSKFLLNFVSLNTSSFITKLLNFILFFFLIRILDPASYGTYTLIWAHITLLAPLLDLGTTSYGLVYLARATRDKINALFSLRVVLSVVVYFLTILLAYVFHYNTQTLTYIWFISLVIFSNMASGTFLIIAASRGKSYLTSVFSVLFNTVLIGTLIAVLMSTKSLYLLIVVTSVFYLMYAAFNIVLLNRIGQVSQIVFDYKSWREIITKSYVFVLIGFLGGLYFKMDVFLLNQIKGAREVGIYSSGYKFYEALMFIAASYNIAATPGLAHKAREGVHTLVKRMQKDILFLMGIGISIVLLTYFIGPIVLPYVFKGEYLRAIPVLKIIILAFPLVLVSSLLLNVLYVLERAHIVVWVYLLQVVFNFVLNIFFIPQFSILASSWITVASEVLNVILLMYFVYQVIHKKLYEHIS